MMNSSSFSLPLPSNTSYHHLCTKSATTLSITSTFVLTKTLLVLPISVLIFLVALQQWRQQQTLSHFESFIYHMVAMDTANPLGCVLFCCGAYIDLPQAVEAGMIIVFTCACGHFLFHVLTCVERYLAVVHPITYLGLRQGGGVRIRNISIACVWLQSLVWVLVVHFRFPVLPKSAFLAFIVLCFGAVSFCCLSVLCVLIRPRPGEVGGVTGESRGLEQSKKRAFHIIALITGVLLVSFVGAIVCIALDMSQLIHTDTCTIASIGFWFNLPNTLVLPVLFLYRAGKLPCYRANAEP